MNIARFDYTNDKSYENVSGGKLAQRRNLLTPMVIGHFSGYRP